MCVETRNLWLTKHPVIFGAAFIAGILVCTPRAFAGTATGSFNVLATVTDSCTIAAPDLNFGTYDPVNGSAGTTAVTVICFGEADGTTLAYSVGGGNNYANPLSARAMESGTTGDYLGYTLSYTLGGTDILVDNGDGLVTLTNGTGGQTLYGFIAAGQNVGAANDYADVVGLSMTY